MRNLQLNGVRYNSSIEILMSGTFRYHCKIVAGVQQNACIFLISFLFVLHVTVKALLLLLLFV